MKCSFLNTLRKRCMPECIKINNRIKIQDLLSLSISSNMSTSTLSCRLVCLQRSHDDIILPDGVTVNVGRSPHTKIIDPRCSRNQVALTSNWSKRKVKVRQLGGNLSAIGGTDIGLNNEVEVSEDATIFILTGQYPHKVIFPGNDVQGNKTKTEKNESSVNVKKEKDVKRDSFKRPSSSNNGLPDAKKKKYDLPSSDAQKPSNVKRASIDKNENDKNIKKESVGNSEEAQVKLVASKLEAMRKNVVEGKSTKTTLKESKDHIKSPSSSSSSVTNTSKTSKQPSSSSPKSPVSEDNTWTQHEHLYVFTSKGVESRNKIAGFDVDGTIILTKSGKTFPTDAHDWKIAFPEIFGKLKQLHKEGFKVVFFTNQLGVARGKIKIEDLKVKIENIVSKLQVPIQVFVATHEGKYRKPVEGMWRKLKSQYNGRVSIEKPLCVYVGDAAGRPADWEPKKKKDFSCSDRLFALNVGLDFKTPEEFFLQRKKAPFNMPVFDPRKLSPTAPMITPGLKLTLDEKELIVLVGFPASGKSHFAKHYLKPKGFTIVNRDTLGSWQKCVKVAQESLVNSSVVVDNTNLTPEERKRYLDCAINARVPCRCLLMTTTFEHCRHNEKFREMTDGSHAKINEMIFNQAKSKFREPSVAEGFNEILKVNFVPNFSSSSMAADYKKFILDK